MIKLTKAEIFKRRSEARLRWMQAVRTEGTPERAAAIKFLEEREARLEANKGIAGLRRYETKRNGHNRLPRFSHLEPATRELAERLLARYIENNKDKWNLPTWNKRYASLVGCATAHARHKIAHPFRSEWRYYWLKNRYVNRLKVLLGWRQPAPIGIEMNKARKDKKSKYVEYKEYENYSDYKE